MDMMSATRWQKTSAELQHFNGCVCESRTTDNRTVGIFKEKHPIAGSRWFISIRIEDGKHCWGYPIGFDTKRNALAYADKYFPPTNEE